MRDMFLRAAQHTDPRCAHEDTYKRRRAIQMQYLQQEIQGLLVFTASLKKTRGCESIQLPVMRQKICFSKSRTQAHEFAFGIQTIRLRALHERLSVRTES